MKLLLNPFYEVRFYSSIFTVLFFPSKFVVDGIIENFTWLLCWLDYMDLVYFLCLFWQHDAACRVIARLRKERDEARSLLAQAERQMPVLATAPATANASALSNGKRGFSL